MYLYYEHHFPCSEPHAAYLPPVQIAGHLVSSLVIYFHFYLLSPDSTISCTTLFRSFSPSRPHPVIYVPYVVPKWLLPNIRSVVFTSMLPSSYLFPFPVSPSPHTTFFRLSPSPQLITHTVTHTFAFCSSFRCPVRMLFLQIVKCCLASVSPHHSQSSSEGSTHPTIAVSSSSTINLFLTPVCIKSV